MTFDGRASATSTRARAPTARAAIQDSRPDRRTSSTIGNEAATLTGGVLGSDLDFPEPVTGARIRGHGLRR